MRNLKRLITVFEKGDDDKFVREIELQNTDLLELQNLFSVKDDNPMFDCFEITTKEASYFEKKYSLKLDLDKYMYYLECNSEE